MVQHLKIGVFTIVLVALPTVSQSKDTAETAFMDVKMKMRDSMPIEYAGIRTSNSLGR